MTTQSSSQFRRRPGDPNVLERWNGEEWLFFCWRDITKVRAS